MPTLTTLNATFDGVNDVPQLTGQPAVPWDVANGFLGYYSVFDSIANDKLIANISLTGSNWTVAAMRFGGLFDNKTILTDLDGNGGRRIDMLKLGKNSDVDLISTQVRFLYGDDGIKHDIELGSADTWAVVLDAAKNIVKTGSGDVGSIDTATNGRGIITVNQGSYVGRVETGNQNDKVTVNGGTIEAANIRGGNDIVIVKNGGRIDSVKALGGNDTVTLRGGSEMGSLRKGNGDLTVTLRDGSILDTLHATNGDMTINALDTSIVKYIKLNGGNHMVTTDQGFVQSFFSYDSNNTISIGDGGVGQMLIVGETQNAHTITASGWIGALQIVESSSDANDDQTVNLTLGAMGADTIRLGHGDDTITTGTGWVEFISTRGGDDIITIGSGGAAIVRTGEGNDKVVTGAGWIEHISTGDGDDIVNLGTGGSAMIRLGGGDDIIKLHEVNPDFGVRILGGSGNDTASFKGFTTGITFSLDEGSQFQNVAAPGTPDVPTSGYFSESLIENVVGTSKGDHITGDQFANILTGLKGKDFLYGLDGKDLLVGGLGNDKLYGGRGRDTLNGGNGRDLLEGGAGNDALRGGAGDDVFVFGANTGVDTISDFVDGSDVMRIADHSGGLGSLSISDQGTDLRVVHDGGVILLLGHSGTTLTGADFEFI